MPLLESKIVSDIPQIDGRRSIQEQHTHDTGVIEDVFYLAEPNDDVEMLLMSSTRIRKERMPKVVTMVRAMVLFPVPGGPYMSTDLVTPA